MKTFQSPGQTSQKLIPYCLILRVGGLEYTALDRNAKECKIRVTGTQMQTGKMVDWAVLCILLLQDQLALADGTRNGLAARCLRESNQIIAGPQL